MVRNGLAFLSAVGLATAPAAASEQLGGTATATIGISGFVPVVCRANLAASIFAVSENETSLGALTEFCNSPRGYQIFVENSPELADATLIVDGREIDLPEAGSTLVVSSDTPAMTTRDVRLANAGGGGSLSFRIVAR